MVASPYNFGVTTKLLTPVPLDMNTVSYRSVHIQPARSVEEIMVDEIAKKLNKDPVAFRLEYLRLARAKAVLQQVAAAAHWGKAMPAGFAQGVGVHQEIAVVHGLHRRDRRSRSDAPQGTQGDDRDRRRQADQPDRHRGSRCQGGLAESISLVLTAGLHIQNGLPLEGSYRSTTSRA